MRVLVVAAHPDDETLGCGATIARHVSEGDEVHVVVMTDNYRSPDIFEHFKEAIKILGVKNGHLFKYPDSELELRTRLELAQSIEDYVETMGVPDVVYTHSEDDLSQDHRATFWAAVTAFRPVWGTSISIYSCEIPSGTDWSPQPFVPNMFVDVGRFMDQKVDALNCYTTEVREFPHPRSDISLYARSKFWGTHCGLECAEAFKIVREVR